MREKHVRKRACMIRKRVRYGTRTCPWRPRGECCEELVALPAIDVMMGTGIEVGDRGVKERDQGGPADSRWHPEVGR